LGLQAIQTKQQCCPKRQSKKQNSFQIRLVTVFFCGIPEIDDQFDNGLVKADITRKHEEMLTTVLFVMKMGPDCYKDKDRFPSGPWCKQGDFILVRPHAGTRVKIHGREFRIINDDAVEGVVEDPRGISRA
jgi:co-chaperonin GroES (HSP10)